MIPDLAISISELLNAAEELIDDPIFLIAIENPDIASYVEKGVLFWNLGNNQGYVAIDPITQKIYRVFEPKHEKLSEHSLCDPAVAQLVLDDIIFLLDVLSEEMDDVLIETIPDLFNSKPNTRLM